MPGQHIRPAGLDFEAGRRRFCSAGRVLDASRIALAAAMGHGSLAVRRQPAVAILATGDELVLPGEVPGPDQIVASNTAALLALVDKAGAEAIDLGIARRHLRRPRDRIAAAKAAQARHPRHARRRLRRRPRSRAGGADPAGHGARLLAHRDAAGKAADARQARAP